MDPHVNLYYPNHEVDAKKYLQDYYSQHVPYSVFKESTINMMRCFYNALNSGLVSGKTLIDISFGSIIVNLLSICEFFQEISIVKFYDADIRELELWRNKDPDAFDWTPILKLFREFKGMSSDRWSEEEENLRGKIKKIMKWEFTEDNLTDSVSPPKADCATSIWALELISKDHEEYKRNLRKFSKLIKLGGYLLLYTDINCTYFKIGEDKFQLLPCDENFCRKVLSEEGLEIEHFENLEKVMGCDLVDHEGIVFIVARKLCTESQIVCPSPAHIPPPSLDSVPQQCEKLSPLLGTVVLLAAHPYSGSSVDSSRSPQLSLENLKPSVQ
ncbi:nicotinamide N-methyltransferase-like [Dendropsophus ebraccatus]|uniref:nicotinamide N-methyltransferase-like n=1 Tax=Dendropsophus ebraccatus TaxID=150705 RepID=UPI0038322B26